MPRQDRRWRSWETLDVPAALAVSLLALVVVALDAPMLVRVPLGLAALFLAPGYVVACALFPRRVRGEPGLEVDAGSGSPMSDAMRFGLGIATSTAVLILVAIAVEAVGPVRPLRILAVLAVITFAAAAAWFARIRRSPVEPPAPVAVAPSVLPGPQASRSLSTMLVAVMVLAGLAGGYALLKPRDAPKFTELYLTASDGVQHCFPDRFVAGAYGFDRREPDCALTLQPGSLLIGVANHEGETTHYWLRTVWTRETLAEDNLTDVLEAHDIQSWEVTLESTKAPDDPSLHDAQYEVPFDLPPPPGNKSAWRMSVQLYTEPPPAVVATSAFLATPDKHVHLWIQVA